jgi:hypothetical protein
LDLSGEKDERKEEEQSERDDYLRMLKNAIENGDVPDMSKLVALAGEMGMENDKMIESARLKIKEIL